MTRQASYVLLLGFTTLAIIVAPVAPGPALGLFVMGVLICCGLDYYEREIASRITGKKRRK